MKIDIQVIKGIYKVLLQGVIIFLSISVSTFHVVPILFLDIPVFLKQDHSHAGILVGKNMVIP